MAIRRQNSPGVEQRKTRLDSLEHLGAFAEGEVFPLRQKRIKRLVGATDDYIVFVDENDMVEWSDGGMNVPSQHGRVISEVTTLQQLSSIFLSPRQIPEYRYSLAMALSRSFGNDAENALGNLACARQVLSERVRFLYIGGSVFATLFVVICAILLWINRDVVTVVLDKPLFEVLIAGLAGATGALASVLLKRDHRIVAHARSAYVLDGASRILLGILGALLMVAAIKANLVAGFLDDRELGVLVVIGALSGFVERLVPRLIDQTGIGAAAIATSQPGDEERVSDEEVEEEEVEE